MRLNSETIVNEKKILAAYKNGNDTDYTIEILFSGTREYETFYFDCHKKRDEAFENLSGYMETIYQVEDDEKVTILN